MLRVDEQGSANSIQVAFENEIGFGITAQCRCMWRFLAPADEIGIQAEDGYMIHMLLYDFERNDALLMIKEKTSVYCWDLGTVFWPDLAHVNSMYMGEGIWDHADEEECLKRESWETVFDTEPAAGNLYRRGSWLSPAIAARFFYACVWR